MTRGSEGK